MRTLRPSLLRRKSLPCRLKAAESYFAKGLGPHKYGCLMLLFSPADSKAILNWTASHIPDDALAQGGRETEPHITVKYGFVDDEPELIGSVAQAGGPITLRLGKITTFPEGDDGVPLKVDVGSPQLHALNAEVAMASETVDKFPEYRPHLTLAYIKPEFVPLLAGLQFPWSDKTLVLDRCEYSSKDGTRTGVPLGVLQECGQKAGFTGKTEDKLGRSHCFQDGKQVACNPGDEPKPDEPKAQLTEPDTGERSAQEQGEPSELSPEEQAKFTQEWDNAVSAALAEADVSQHDFTPEEAAQEQNWHGQFMQWRWGSPGILPPAEAGKAVRFVTGLANPAVGTAEHLNQLAGQVKTPPDKGLLVELVEVLQTFFGILPELLDPAARVIGGTLGESAVATVKAAKKTKLGGKPKVTQLSPSTVKERARLAPNEGRYVETTQPTSEQRGEAKAPTGPTAKGNAREIANRRNKLKKQSQGKQRAWNILSPEERAERLAKARAKRARKNRKQEAESEAFWKRRGKKDLSWLDASRGGALVPPPKRLKPTRLRRKGLLDSSARWLSSRWNVLEARYGRAQALTMLGAMLATAPIPGNIAAVIAAAEALRYFVGTVPHELKSVGVYGTKQWVTVGGGPCEDGEGQHCGGTPMDIGKDGKVRKGPAALKGRKLPKSRLRRKPAGKQETKPASRSAEKPEQKPAKQPTEAEMEQMLAEAPESQGTKPKPEKEPVAEKPKATSASQELKPAEPANKDEDAYLKGKKPKQVKVGSAYFGPAKRAEVLANIFGKEVPDDLMGAMTNAPDGSSVDIQRGYEPGQVIARISSEKDGITAMRSFGKDKEGKKFVHNEIFVIESNSPHKGKGVEFFRDQVAALREASVDYIETHAAGNKSDKYYNGYYTWPRMGYDGTMSDKAIKKLPKKFRDQLKGKKNVQALFALPGGKEAWKEHGDDIFDAKFDLSEGSQSLKILEAYLKERSDRGK